MNPEFLSSFSKGKKRKKLDELLGILGIRKAARSYIISEYIIGFYEQEKYRRKSEAVSRCHIKYLYKNCKAYLKNNREQFDELREVIRLRTKSGKGDYKVPSELYFGSEFNNAKLEEFAGLGASNYFLQVEGLGTNKEKKEWRKFFDKLGVRTFPRVDGKAFNNLTISDDERVKQWFVEDVLHKNWSCYKEELSNKQIEKIKEISVPTRNGQKVKLSDTFVENKALISSLERTYPVSPINLQKRIS